MTCKECIYKPMCKYNQSYICENFKDKSKFTELSLNVGDTVYIKGIPLKISFIHIEKEIVYAIEFDCSKCDDCPFSDNKHNCKTNGYFEFTDKDIGKTVLLSVPEITKIDLMRIRRVLGYFERRKKGLWASETMTDEAEYAIKALKKQLPKRPLPDERYYGNGRCPNCNAVFIDKSTNYCGNCGQALDWSK